MAAQTSMIHIRVDDKIKAQATETLHAIGLTVSDAVRLFLHRVVVEQAVPFALKVPSGKTRIALDEAEDIIQARVARFSRPGEIFDDLEKNSAE